MATGLLGSDLDTSEWISCVTEFCPKNFGGVEGSEGVRGGFCRDGPRFLGPGPPPASGGCVLPCSSGLCLSWCVDSSCWMRALFLSLISCMIRICSWIS